MLETITAVNQAVNSFIWGIPAMVCIIGVGLLLSVRTGFLQIRKFPYAIRTTIGRIFRRKDASDGAMTPFQAVCTALAATVGTGKEPDAQSDVELVALGKQGVENQAQFGEKLLLVQPAVQGEEFSRRRAVLHRRGGLAGLPRMGILTRDEEHRARRGRPPTPAPPKASARRSRQRD